MSLIAEVLKELVGMFVGDARLSAAVLAVVAVSAVVADGTQLDPLVGGGILLVGCLLLVVESARRHARRVAQR
ncbi:hypothetical protein SAMN06265365_119110 [Tistlia consotensis]|uniref:Uncharacterized protein n=1 Tax=Tistlia consotensis USBA 355 TaxID=560819 RepID=A0A1Y6CDG0_9PROT|nr:hypothetical protein [Tistlia consotensis]SMF55804.1 hypothetical protein SAMN05428998_120110 [Tistlia consotensis USBA 355]SNR89358.1 hypothetical protein SAMN06265365_119110 [Tistlia consotensis]